jgi:hypothetical protein
VDVEQLRGREGINLENWSAPPGISYITIEGFTIDGNDFPPAPGGYGPPEAGIRVVAVDPDDGHDIILRNNHCLNCAEWGILDGHINDSLYENNECAGSIGQHGIYHSNSGDRITLRGNTCHDNNGCGIHMNGDISQEGDGMLSNCVVEGNVIYENGASGGSGINCDGVRDSIIRNNLVYASHASGISLYQIDAAGPAINNVVVNNTIVVAANGRWAMNLMTGSTGTTLRNNIFLNLHAFRGSITMTADCLTGFTSDYNVVMDRLTADDGNSVLSLVQWKGATGQDAHTLVATPGQLFVNPSGLVPGDYVLSATSPAVDTGDAAEAPLVDLAGVARPQRAAFDIGCYELP